MRRRAGTDLEESLLRLHDEISARRPLVMRRYSGLVRAARDHARDPERAAAALDVIARERLYRLGRHASLAAFAVAELGISRASAMRLLARAPERRAQAARRQADAATSARALRAWLRQLGVRGAKVRVVGTHPARVELVLPPAATERLIGGGRARGPR